MLYLWHNEKARIGGLGVLQSAFRQH